MLTYRLVSRFFSADASVIDATFDQRILAALAASPRRPAKFIGVMNGALACPALPPGARVVKAPKSKNWSRELGSDHALVIAMEPDLLPSLGTLIPLGMPGAYYLVRAPGSASKKIERSGFAIERAVGLDVDPELARENLHPALARGFGLLAKLYGDDVLSGLAAPLLDGADARSTLFVLRDAKRAVRPDPRPPRRNQDDDPQVKATRASVEAARKRRSDRGGDRRPGRVQDHDGPERRGRPRGQGIGAFVRERILAGEAPERTLAKVHERWPESTAKMSDWHWNRRKLVKEGLIR